MDSEDVQLPHLETFSKVAELSSFTGAAKALGLTQAAVSQRIQALEMSLGKSLFQRRGSRVLLTQAGQTLYIHSQRILESIDKLAGRSQDTILPSRVNC